jgi:hypothetical protein
LLLFKCDAAEQGDQRLQPSNVETGPATVRPHRSRLEHRPQQQAHRKRIVGRLRQGNLYLNFKEMCKVQKCGEIPSRLIFKNRTQRKKKPTPK